MTISIKGFVIKRNMTIKDAMRRLSEIGEKQLFVVDGKNQLIGALSDGDIRKWIIRGGSLRDVVEKICNLNPITINSGYSPEYVRNTMLKLKIEAIPVVDDSGQVERVLTWDDVFSGKVDKQKEKINAPVFIMAGGKGTRLDPFTRILPKPLIPVGDKPIIEVIMEKFNEYGVNHFYVSLNHKSRMIKSYFEEANETKTITYIEEDKPLGTVGSLRLITGKLKEPFFVTNCDVLIDTDYAELMRFHQNQGNDLTITVSCRHFVIPYGVCEIEKGGRLKEIREKPEHDLLVNTGLYLMNNKIRSLIPKNKFFNFTDLVKKAKHLKVGVFPVPEDSWIDVGQWEEYYKTISQRGKWV